MKKKSFLGLMFVLIMLCVINTNANAQMDNNTTTTITTPIQNSTRLYVITQGSTNCSMCNDNMARWNSDVVGHYSTDPGVVFLNYDMTDDASMLRTRADLDKYGIYDSMSGYNTAGSVLFIDPATRRVVGTSTLDATSSDMLKSIGTYSGNPSPGTK